MRARSSLCIEILAKLTKIWRMGALSSTICFVFVSFFSTSIFAQDATELFTTYRPLELPENFEDLQRKLGQKYHFQVPDYTNIDYQTGGVYFFRLNNMKSGQHEISYLEVEHRIAVIYYNQQKQIKSLEKKKKKKITYDEIFDTYNIFPFDHNLAAFTETNPGEVILLKDCVLLIDGNHKAIASIWVGAQTFPARVKLDLRTKSVAEALPQLIKDGFVWPYIRGERILDRVGGFNELIDNPLRSWVSKAIAVVRLKATEDGYEYLKKKNIKHPLAVKLDRERAFWEWVIVLALESQNFQGHIGQETSPTKKSIELAREKIKLAMASGFAEIGRLKEIFMIYHSEDYQNDEALLKELSEFLKIRDCKGMLP